MVYGFRMMALRLMALPICLGIALPDDAYAFAARLNSHAPLVTAADNAKIIRRKRRKKQTENKQQEASPHKKHKRPKKPDTRSHESSQPERPGKAQPQKPHASDGLTCSSGRKTHKACACAPRQRLVRLRHKTYACLPAREKQKERAAKPPPGKALPLPVPARQLELVQTRLKVMENKLACVGGQQIKQACVCAPSGRLVQLRENVHACLPPAGHGQGDAIAMPDLTAQPQAGTGFAADELLANLSLATSEASLAALAARNRLQVTGNWPLKLTGKRLVKFRAANGQPLQDMQAALLKEPLIITVQNNFYYERQSSAMLPAMGAPQYALELIRAHEAHDVAQGEGSLVAVIDSGIDQTHPDLAGQIRSVFLAAPEAEQVLDPHGTAIAGVVAAKGFLLGVAPSASLLDVRVFQSLPAQGRSIATTESLLRGLDWAATQKCNIINMSLAGPDDPLMKLAVEQLVARGIIVVAAAGNGGAKAAPAFPAAYDGVIAVTATGTDNTLYGYANEGSYIDLAAPGVDLIVAAPQSSYRIDSGTSLAAAEVSGIAALVLSQNPDMPASEVSLALLNSAVDLGPSGPDPKFGAGLVNAWGSLQGQ